MIHHTFWSLFLIFTLYVGSIIFVLYCLGSCFPSGLRSGLKGPSGWHVLQGVFWTNRKVLWQTLQRYKRCFTSSKFSVLKYTYDTWYFYFNATTSLQSMLDPATGNCKSLLKTYFNWLQQRCHVNQKNKNWKDASLIQN